MRATKDTEWPIKGRSVGKKRKAVKAGKKPHQQFAARLRLLAGERTTVELGGLIGVSPNTVGKWFKGERTPELDQWPAIAKAFGLDHWTDLLPR